MASFALTGNFFDQLNGFAMGLLTKLNKGLTSTVDKSLYQIIVNRGKWL